MQASRRLKCFMPLLLMIPQDKAALLASMDPASVTRLLAAMEPNEAVVILSALGNEGGRLVAETMPGEARSKLIKVGLRRPAAVCMDDGCVLGAQAWARLGGAIQPSTAPIAHVFAYKGSQAGKKQLLMCGTSYNYLQVLQNAEAAPSKKKKGRGAGGGQKQQHRGSFRDCRDNAETVGRLMTAYEVRGAQVYWGGALHAARPATLAACGGSM